MPNLARARRIAARYVAGATLEEAGRPEGVSASTAMRDLRALGLNRRKPDPAPSPRTCARDGCSETFRPTHRQVEQGYGLYCSRECDHLAHRKYPKPEERQCETCGRPFTPASHLGANDAKGWNRYCSRPCARLAQRGKRGARAVKGQRVECKNCGREVFRYDCELTEHPEGFFCSTACHAEHRRRFPWPGYRTFLSPAASGKARQRAIGAREGRIAGASGGRKREYSPLQARGVLELRQREPSLGVRRLADRTGLSVMQVRRILADAA
jgi:hypothetical protein